ncbi:methylated-DNA--[protein]-cysteine S-methyltransferase [Actinocrinis puniceicyclus]|uniref:Methylated-DNA--protein-cysteine methyltransferase n=1 Tax=Actinocrinis puniceicyclus TaxID=977794 RepID=A0A8J7WQR1_9ACTN|nr:methylated-DNA--[protein]-cysteine S-methyltransferase [Actinocrinis puniceicyclus]MBS2963780.1 methylated-DNA--[protein]-cysteine S-methyltransferase [Actinocrinis puniceicyclus]
MPAPGSHHPLPAGSARGDIDSPVGPLGAVVGPHGLLRLTFGSLARFADGLAACAPGAPAEGAPSLSDHEHGASIIRELGEYFAGRRTSFTIAVDWSLTSGAQRAILSTLHAEVHYGETIGYGDLAVLAGRTPGASRLVGTVMGSNPIVIVVPCHRVIAADGGIGGFGGGLETKRRLLTLEGSLQPTLF